MAYLLANCAEAKSRDPVKAVQLAKKAVELTPKDRTCWQVLGMAQYRAGDCKASVVALEKSMALRKGGDANDWIFLAMARWRLGDHDGARKWYAQTVQWMEQNHSKDKELGRFREEAEKLLESKK